MITAGWSSQRKDYTTIKFEDIFEPGGYKTLIKP